MPRLTSVARLSNGAPHDRLGSSRRSANDPRGT